jgi:hypothetical protein
MAQTIAELIMLQLQEVIHNEKNLFLLGIVTKPFVPHPSIRLTQRRWRDLLLALKAAADASSSFLRLGRPEGRMCVARE